MSFIINHDAHVHFTYQGTGVPTVMLHGLSDSSQFFKPLIGNLTGIKMIQTDLRGHGESDKDAEITMELLTEDIICILDELQIKTANILGFSMGSTVAQNLSIEFPERVNSLILCSGYSRCGHELSKTFKNLSKITQNGGISAFFDEMIKLVYTPNYLLKHRELYNFKDAVVQMNSQSAIEKSIEVCRNFDVLRSLTDIDVPCLIMYGSEDMLISPENSQIMHESLNSELLSFQTGHNFFLPENIRKIAIEIQKFLVRI